MKKYQYLGAFLLFFIWFFSFKLELIDTFFLPNPLNVIIELFKLLFSGEIIKDLFSTIKIVILAFILAAVTGIPLGLFLGSSKKVYQSFEFIIDFFRSTPATALFPLFLLIFGIDNESKIALASFTAMIIIIFNTAHGVMNATKSRILEAQIMGANKMQIFKWILFWESLPQTFIGLKNGISLSLVIVIVTEMFIGTASGLGKKIIDSQITYEITTMYAVILLTGFLGYLLNYFLNILEKKILHWKK